MIGYQNPHIYCNGLFSCAAVGSMYINEASIECYGEQSCSDSTITTASSGTKIVCAGYCSCCNSNVTYGTTAIMYGYLAVDTQLIFKGSSSGSKAIIYCNDGHICNIECSNNQCMIKKISYFQQKITSHMTVDVVESMLSNESAFDIFILFFFPKIAKQQNICDIEFQCIYHTL